MNFTSRSVFYRTITVGFLVGVSAYAATESYPVSYHADIAPILSNHCIECHQPEGVGPFSLHEFTAVKRRARQIIEVTESRFMPPWKPASGFGPALVGERRLNEAELSLLQRWVEQGMPAGEQKLNAPPPSALSTHWQLGKPDLILELPEPFLLPSEGKDIYRNIVLPFPLAESRYVRAIEIKPGSSQAVHHALLMLDETGRAQHRDSAEVGVGYDGMGIGSAIAPAGQIIGWTPGQAPHKSPAGTAWEISPDIDLVLQLHLLPTGKVEEIKPKIGLYFTDEAPSRSSWIIQLRNFDIDIPAGESDYRVRESITLPAPAMVVGLYPHAHYVARDLKIYATLPNGKRQWLLRIPDWDFNWQGDYRFQEPLSLPAGAILQMDYAYDNSATNPRNPSSPPIDVKGGWGSLDEMAEAMIQVIPERPEDLALLRQAQLDYDIAQAGGEARYHYFNGTYLELQEEWQRAIASYQRALELDPEFASARFKLGALAERNGDLASAQSHYLGALAIRPELVPARLALAKLRFLRGEIDAARDIFRTVHRENPTNLTAVLDLTRFHHARGELDDARSVLTSAAKHFEGSPQFQLEFGETLWALAQTDEAESRFERVTQIAKESSTSATVEKAALLRLAEIHDSRGNFSRANQLIKEALVPPTDSLDALLLATNISLQLGHDADALAHLINLVDRPPATTFAPLDILANLRTPVGIVLLVDAYLQCENWADAQTLIDHAIPILTNRGLSEIAAPLEDRRDELQRRISP